MQQGPWRQGLARDLTRLGLPDAECLTLQLGVGSGPRVERTDAIVKRDGSLVPVEETIRLFQHRSVSCQRRVLGNALRCSILEAFECLQHQLGADLGKAI